jgi:hypothetical protein
LNDIDGSKKEDTKFVAKRSLYKNTTVKKLTINTTMNKINLVDLSLKKKKIKKKITTNTIYLNMTGKNSDGLYDGSFGCTLGLSLII